MNDAFLAMLFSSTGLFYGVAIPFFGLQLLALLMIASLLNKGATVRGVAKAIYCYIMQIVGVILLTTGALPTLYSVLSGFAYDSSTYIALLILFATGGIIFLWHDQMVREIDSGSRAVPQMMYVNLFRLVGTVLALLSLLSLVLMVILEGSASYTEWITPLVLMCYGLVFVWASHDEGEHTFRTIIMTSAAMPRPAVAAAAVKPAAAKKAPPAKKKRKSAKKKVAKKKVAKSASAKATAGKKAAPKGKRKKYSKKKK